MPFDEVSPEWGGDDDFPLSDYQITANAFLVSLQEGVPWRRLHEIWQDAPDALTFEGLCRLEVYKMMEACDAQ
jgi:hypothetical protein